MLRQPPCATRTDPPFPDTALVRSRTAPRHLAGMTTFELMQRAAGPDFGAVGGAADMRKVIGALLTYGLMFACLMIIISAAAWAISSSNGSWQSASKAKAGVFVALGGAALTGGALVWANWLLDVGAAL